MSFLFGVTFQFVTSEGEWQWFLQVFCGNFSGSQGPQKIPGWCEINNCEGCSNFLDSFRMFTVVKMSFIKEVVIDFPMLISQKNLVRIICLTVDGLQKSFIYVTHSDVSISRY